MKLELTSKRRLLFTLGMAIPLGILLAVVGLFFTTSSTLHQSRLWVEHSLEVRSVVAEMALNDADIDSSTRGFLLTGLDRDLGDYAASVATAPRLIAHLRYLTRDNPRQQKSLDALERVSVQKIAFAAQAVDLKKTGHEADLLALLNSGRDAELIGQMRTTLAAMTGEEDRLLVLRRGQLERGLVFRNRLLMSLLVLDILAVGVLVLIFLRLQRLQQLVTVCAWSRTIRYENEWITFEEYLQRRFDLRVTHGISEVELSKLRHATESMPPKQEKGTEVL